MTFTPWLPPELWLLVFQLVASYPSPCISSVYTPFEPSVTVLTFNEKLQARRSLVLVCKHWKALATELLYEDLVLNRDPVNLRQRLAGNNENADEVFGKLVRRVVLPYDLTATYSPRHIRALDVLLECSHLETLVRPPCSPLHNLRWEYPTPSIPFIGLRRLDWWHYNEAARAGGINSFHHMLQFTPNLLYLSISGSLMMTFHRSSPISLPRLTTLRLGAMNMLFVQQICRWSLPSLIHVVLDASYGQGMESLWNAFGNNLQVVELGSYSRFRLDDHISIILPKCPNLRQFNYHVMFMSLTDYSDVHPAITSIGLHAQPRRPPSELDDEEAIALVVAHMVIVSGAAFPGLQELVLYGDWSLFMDVPGFLDMKASMSMRGVSVVKKVDDVTVTA